MQHPGCTHRQDSRIGLRFACGNGGGDDSGDEDEEEEEYEEAGIRFEKKHKEGKCDVGCKASLSQFEHRMCQSASKVSAIQNMKNG
ncbi:hypothetical protein F2P81_013815 [Scophthalmus maximus]|uniref:Uncharacterized protein n=1 Tax=Scophthalmus maximus TaxID=52904 RepID=A0A6A4SMA3_SCOMX|nr:hypothetical protein F2P81_013815 [Scophthalmus maximus]